MHIAETHAPQPISNRIESLAHTSRACACAQEIQNPPDGRAVQEWEIDFDKSYQDSKAQVSQLSDSCLRLDHLAKSTRHLTRLLQSLHPHRSRSRITAPLAVY